MSIALCIAAGGFAAVLNVATFTLSWEHSIEKTEWRETWRATATGLVPLEARIRGSGAGMEPPPEARLRDGWFVWRPAGGPLGRLVLPDSDYAAPMHLCPEGQPCRPLRAFLPPAAPAGAPVSLRTVGAASPCEENPSPP